MNRFLVIGTLASLLAAAPTLAQDGGGTVQVPFAPGERMEYSVGYGPLPAGSLRIAVDDLVTYEGSPAYHIVFDAKTNRAVSFVYDLDTREESWLDARHLYSLRYRRHAIENDRTRVSDTRFDQKRHVRIDEEGNEKPTSPRAVDQLSMIYFLRLLPLDQGVKYVLENQADPDDNPIKVRVLKKDRVRVPAGTFETWVLDLDVKTDSGMFKKGGENRIWVTADARHVPVKISSKIGLGSFTAELTDYTAGQPVASR